MYGEEKNKEMIRSILPSTRRKNAKAEKKALNRRLRRNARQSLSQIYDEDDWDESSFDFWNDGQEERYWIVQDRRAADKISHFMRWAEQKASHMPDGQKMGYIRGILPGKGTIFEHACFHLEGLEGFDKDKFAYRRYWRERRVLTKVDLIRFLKEICEIRKYQIYLNNALREFHKTIIQNKILKKKRVFYFEKEYIDGKYVNVGEEKSRIEYITKPFDVTGSPRLLMGMMDVEDFVEDIIEASIEPNNVRKEGFLLTKMKRSGRYDLLNRYDEYLYYEGMTINPNRHSEWLQVVKLFVEDYINNPEELKTFTIYKKNKKRRRNYRPYSVYDHEDKRWYGYSWKL